MLFLLFQVGEGRYALEASRVVEVLPLMRIDQLPQRPAGVTGVLCYRGAPLPVIDLSAVILGRPAGAKLSTRILVINCAGGRRVGLIAERANETLKRERSEFTETGVALEGVPYLGPVTRDGRGFVHVDRSGSTRRRRAGPAIPGGRRLMDAIVNHLRAAIGLDAASIGLGAIERAVQHRLAATRLKTIDRYSQLLQSSPDEMRALIDAIVVPETWFFRDRGAFSAVVAEARKPGPLRYLCVPCATGEEPLSLAMTLLDAGLAPERFHIDAFDICERLVIHAARGKFTAAIHSAAMTPSIATATSRRPGRAAPSIPPCASRRLSARRTCSRIIRCPARRSTTRFSAATCLFTSTPPRRPRRSRKSPACSARMVSFASRPLRPACCSATASSPRTCRRPSPFATASASSRQNRLSVTSLKQVARQVPHARSPRSRANTRAAQAGGRGRSPPLADAMRLADEGRFEEVLRICHAHIDANGGSADAFYLLALVSDATDRHEEAATLYRKALYLDPQHRGALAHFSLLSDKLGHTAAAGALRQRAMRIESNAA